MMTTTMLAIAIAFWSAHAAPPVSTINPPSTPAEELIKPIVCQFDFDESDAAPNSLPPNFVRNIAPSQGFPNFGSMRLTNQMACSGAGSFEFELAGGSMSASVPTSVIPILPLVDYEVSAKVRTQGLVNSGARLVAWLHNKAGQPIQASRVQSPIVRSKDEWESLRVSIHGDYPDAADLVLELQIVQPAHQDGHSMAMDEPRPQDVAGRAWFDDVIVAHVPRVSLVLSQPENIIQWPDQPTFEVRVNELSSQRLTARLRILDIDDRLVFDISFPAPRGRHGGTVPVQLERFGWYRAVLEVKSNAGEVRRTELAFAYMAKSLRRANKSNRFGIVLDDVSNHRPSTISVLTVLAGSGFSILPVWHADTGSKRDQTRQFAMRELIERLMQADVDLIFSLQDVPGALAATTGLKRHEVGALLSADVDLWRPYLDDLLVTFGLEVRRWLVGSPFNDGFETDTALRAGMNAAFGTLAEFVPEPQIFACRPLEHAPTIDSAASFMLVAPHQVSPSAIEDYLSLWNGGGDHRPMIFLHQLPERFTARARVVDLLHRALYAWRSGADGMIIKAPWFDGPDGSGSIMPDATFLPWQMFVQQMNGRSFAGELPLAPGTHCWLLKGSTPSDAALVAWCDDARDESSVFLKTQLSHGAIEALDTFGNATVIQPVGFEHSIRLSETPTFITNVDLDLVQFRGSAAITPSFMPAVPKIHEHELILENPWETPLSGTIRLASAELLTITPSVQDFAIPPRGLVRLPLQIVPDRSIIGGRKRITAEVLLQSDRKQTLQVELELEVGLKNIDMTATWSSSRNPVTGDNDLVVSAAVTNKGERRSTLDVYLMAEGVGQNRRTIAALNPGETTVRTFRIPKGAALLAGQQIRVGVAERDGLTRLNQVLTIASP